MGPITILFAVFAFCMIFNSISQVGPDIKLIVQVICEVLIILVAVYGYHLGHLGV